MKTPGIHNPFKKPEPEVEEGVATSLTLDGDSYTLTFENTTVNTVQERLFKLLYEVNKLYPSHLKNHGIHITKEKGVPIRAFNMSTLITGQGPISVFNPTKKEEEVFRRIAHTLMLLSIKSLLKEQGVSIIQRS